MIQTNITSKYTEIYVDGGGILTQSYPTYFHSFFKRKILTKNENIEDYKEVTEAEKTALEKSDAEWTEPPRSFVDLWNQACVIAKKRYGCYNEDTGYFELYSLKDLTYEDASLIYQLGCVCDPQDSFKYANNFNRANLPSTLVGFTINSLQFIGYNNRVMEVFHGTGVVSPIVNSFGGCNNLKELLGLCELNYNGKSYILPLVTKIEFDFLRPYDFKLICPKLGIETFKLILDKKTFDTAITITVHPDVYAKLTDPENAEWYQLNQDALNKNIIFATE